MEAEYIALAHVAKEAVWLCALTSEIGINAPSATALYTDNQAAISFARDTQFHARSKHIDIRHHFVRERIQDHSITVSHCTSADNTADILTKGLARSTHAAQLDLLNMSPC